MSPNGQLALCLATLPMPAGHRFDWHSHSTHQVAWAEHGVLTVVTAGGTWVLPPSRALWIPAGTPHETRANGNTALRGIYLDPEHSGRSWSKPQPLAVGTLLQELFRQLDRVPVGARSEAETLMLSLLEPVDVVTVELTMPADPRARDVATGLLVDPADGRSLAQWGRTVGASPRTLTRAFLAGTGIPFRSWRTAARMRAALPHLAAGEPIGRVAELVGYETASAFVAAFRRETGTTPGAYFRR